MLCVFAGSAPGVPPEDLDLAAAVGTALAGAGVPIVYGGGSTGCMGAMADAALAAGARVVGVVPHGLFHAEEVHAGVERIEVASLHERKRVMIDRADAFVVLPGGLGTLDEVGEVLTWGQLGIHAAPTVVVDPTGYWRPLVEWYDRAVLRGYVSVAARDFLLVVRDATAVLPAIRAFTAPAATRGPLSLDQT